MSKLVTKDTMHQEVGKETGVSSWFEITQEDVNSFADVTRDHQFIHVDPEKAAQTPFGGPIGHGFLTLSMLSYFAGDGCGISIENAKMGINYGCDKIRFLNPVRVGSRIRGRAKLISVEEKSLGQFLFKQEYTVAIEGVEKPALIAQWLTLIIV